MTLGRVKTANRTAPKNQKTINSDNFLEALRGLGSGVTQSLFKDVVTGFKPDQKLPLDQELPPNQLLDLKEKVLKKEAPFFQNELTDLRRQEKVIFTQAEQETRLQIQAVQEELKKLAAATQNLAKEVEVAIKQTPVEPGTYHLNFWLRLRQFLLLFRQKIEESATWLGAFHQKSQKRSFYWRQVKRSGTKFMLSAERYSATQAG